MEHHPPPAPSPVDPGQYKLVKLWLIASMTVSLLSILAVVRGAPPIAAIFGLVLGLVTLLGVYLPMTRGRYARAAVVGVVLGVVLVALNLVTVAYFLSPGAFISLAAQSGVLYAGFRCWQWSRA